MNIVVVGIGLIGGSLIKAFKKHNFENVKGIDVSEEVISKCVNEGLIMNLKESDDDILSNADLVFICLYPEIAIKYLKDNMSKFKPGVILTDVVGLKGNFMKQVNDIKRDDITFIGGHPMAGKEGKGFEVSCESIFEDANYLLVVENDIDSNHVDALIDVIYKIGCSHVEILNSDEHDEIITYSSHMPHILSSTFMSLNDNIKTKNCIAGSFRDFTRVSDINPELWTELIMENRELVLDEISKFKTKLSELEDHIKRNDNNSVNSFLSDAKLKKRELNR